jgi:WD40 repeat protein/mono/diheme cytochrome c family protein
MTTDGNPRIARALLGVPALALLLFATATAAHAQEAAKPAAANPKPVSFFKEIRPILQSQCVGCHQPAKAGGKLDLTGHANLLALDKHGDPIVAPGKPDESELLAAISPRDDKPPKMPKGKTPLPPAQVALITRWITESAVDDTPAAAAETFTMDHPPVYRQQPVVTSLDFSPMESPKAPLLAVSGYHEVFLYELANETVAAPEPAAASKPATIDVRLAARLVGMSERIESAVFSPDGATLLVVGGSPARMGELQLWDVAERKLASSLPLGFDTLYGGSWSPDGNFVAFGGGDNSVRALDVLKGELVFFNAAGEDLVRDTAFSKDASHLVSVGRDRSLKLMEFKTQQFVDNITSITPGALKGGLVAVDRQPGSDVLLVGGADGKPKTYNMYRTKDRVIGDDYNLVKAYAPMNGCIFAARFAPDGKRFVVGASDAGKGEVRLYSVDQEAPVWSLPMATAIYAAAFRADGALIAAGGFDGEVVLLDAASGQVVRHFAAAPTNPGSSNP